MFGSELDMQLETIVYAFNDSEESGKEGQAESEGDMALLYRLPERLALFLRLAQFHLGFWSRSVSDVQSSPSTRIGLLVRTLVVS